MNIDIHSYIEALHEWSHHWEGLAGWVGAIGSIVAIFVAWSLARAEYRRTRKKEIDMRMREVDLIMSPVIVFVTQLKPHIDATKYLILEKPVDESIILGMADLAELPVVNWPSIYMYICFKKMWHSSSEFLELVNKKPPDEPAISASKEVCAEWIEKFGDAANKARESIKKFT